MNVCDDLIIAAGSRTPFRSQLLSTRRARGSGTAVGVRRRPAAGRALEPLQLARQTALLLRCGGVEAPQRLGLAPRRRVGLLQVGEGAVFGLGRHVGRFGLGAGGSRWGLRWRCSVARLGHARCRVPGRRGRPVLGVGPFHRGDPARWGRSLAGRHRELEQAALLRRWPGGQARAGGAAVGSRGRSAQGNRVGAGAAFPRAARFRRGGGHGPPSAPSWRSWRARWS